MCGVWIALPSVSRASGVWITLAAGVPGASAPTATSDFQIESSSLVAVNQLFGTGTVHAGTGGGDTFFGSLGTPVLLNLSDGSAYLAAGDIPTGASNRGPGGASAGVGSTTAPIAGGAIPSNAALLGITVAEPGLDASRTLTATIVDGEGNTLGASSLMVPNAGWWVIGLGPVAEFPLESLPPSVPVESPEGSSGTPVPRPSRSLNPPSGVPEPASISLVSSGLISFMLIASRRRTSDRPGCSNTVA
jgi:hypothetical protein